MVQLIMTETRCIGVEMLFQENTNPEHSTTMNMPEDIHEMADEVLNDVQHTP